MSGHDGGGTQPPTPINPRHSQKGHTAGRPIQLEAPPSGNPPSPVMVLQRLWQGLREHTDRTVLVFTSAAVLVCSQSSFHPRGGGRCGCADQFGRVQFTIGVWAFFYGATCRSPSGGYQYDGVAILPGLLAFASFLAYTISATHEGRAVQKILMAIGPSCRHRLRLNLLTDRTVLTDGGMDYFSGGNTRMSRFVVFTLFITLMSAVAVAIVPHLSRGPSPALITRSTSLWHAADGHHQIRAKGLDWHDYWAFGGDCLFHRKVGGHFRGARGGGDLEAAVVPC